MSDRTAMLTTVLSLSLMLAGVYLWARFGRRQYSE